MSIKKKKKLPLAVAITWIIISTMVVTPSMYSVIRVLQKRYYVRHTDPKYQICSLVQAGLSKRAVSSAFLAEKLALSANRPKNIFSFDCKKGEEALTSTAVIQHARIRRMPPDTLYVEYDVRTPLVKIGDYENVAIDHEGIAFPITPFFTPKKLPEVILGESSEKESVQYNEKFSHSRLDFALELFYLFQTFLREYPLVIETVDVSKMDEKSFGKREVVVVVKYLPPQEGRHYLRLTPKNYEKELGNYLSLTKSLPKKTDQFEEKVIDLRIGNIAYINTNYEK